MSHVGVWQRARSQRQSPSPPHRLLARAEMAGCSPPPRRILLAAVHQHAARYKRYIVPVVSLSIDFYIRVFVRVYTSGVPRCRRPVHCVLHPVPVWGDFVP